MLFAERRLRKRGNTAVGPPPLRKPCMCVTERSVTSFPLPLWNMIREIWVVLGRRPPVFPGRRAPGCRCDSFPKRRITKRPRPSFSSSSSSSSSPSQPCVYSAPLLWRVAPLLPWVTLISLSAPVEIKTFVFDSDAGGIRACAQHVRNPLVHPSLFSSPGDSLRPSPQLPFRLRLALHLSGSDPPAPLP